MPKDVTQTRGYRNKNPGNIDYVASNKWQGLADPPWEPGPGGKGKGRFCVFISHQHGIRALAVLLITYYDRHKLRTPKAIISRWAPDSENNTKAYVDAVCRHGGWQPNQALDLHRYEDLRPLVEAIIAHELGAQPYDAQTINQALTMAGVPSPTATPMNSRTAKAAAVTGATGVGTAAGVQMLTELAPHASDATSLAIAVGPWVVALVVVVVAGFFIWQRWHAQKELVQ